MYKTISWKELVERQMAKKHLAEIIGLPDNGVDFALPQTWLNHFIQWSGLDYHMVLCTTFMVYDSKSTFGMVVSGCSEVQDKLNQYQEN